ncbi:hypothetical protein HMPREF3171_00055 [Corynebacterium sp. HMSC08F01]|uniref:hypothetical protein n=1 Tax=Corynebacterium sp. HMSC08F01 TaxID=1581139 RepID=UPI0008A3B391|nr:hypothetical protein [Corynebacterium sp. HMSC08F01]OFT32838.1 hypothetical protein HMPREF3171_00055 [Corynebacterium sp. HMSC08F01]
MAGMFPTMVSDPNDKNRRYSGEATEQWPRPLRTAYYLVVASAVLMIVIGLMTLAKGVPDRLPDTWMIEGADEALIERFRFNLRILAWGNIALAILLSMSAAYFHKGSKTARRIAAASIGATVFLNVAGFFIGVAGWASIVVVVLLVAALFGMFRPAANVFVDTRSGDLWRGVA